MVGDLVIVGELVMTGELVVVGRLVVAAVERDGEAVGSVADDETLGGASDEVEVGRADELDQSAVLVIAGQGEEGVVYQVGVV